MSTQGLALPPAPSFVHAQPMVAKLSARAAADLEQKKVYLRDLKRRAGLSNAAIAREVAKRRGRPLSPQAVGDWFSKGTISSDNLHHLLALADGPSSPTRSKAERFAAALDIEQEEPRNIQRLRQSITVLRKAVVMLALAANEKKPGVVKAFAAYLKAAVPDEYYGERGFHALLEAGLPLAAEIAEEEQDELPEPQEDRSIRKARR